MKTSKKYSGVILVILIAAAVLYFVQKRKINKLSEQTQVQAIELSQLQDSVLTYATKNGQLISKINSVEVDKRNLREALGASGLEIRDLKDKDIRWRKLVSVLRADLEAVGKGTTTVTDTFKVVETDTVYYQLINDWTNNYLSLSSMTIEGGDFDFSYSYKTPIEIYTEELRKKTIVTVSLPDPEAKITTGTSITIERKTKWYKQPWLWGVAGLTTGILILK